MTVTLNFRTREYRATPRRNFWVFLTRTEYVCSFYIRSFRRFIVASLARGRARPSNVIYIPVTFNCPRKIPNRLFERYRILRNRVDGYVCARYFRENLRTDICARRTVFRTANSNSSWRGSGSKRRAWNVPDGTAYSSTSVYVIFARHEKTNVRHEFPPTRLTDRVKLKRPA